MVNLEDIKEIIDSYEDLIEDAETHDVDPAAIESFIHGTTVGVNTVIQRKGAAMALENKTECPARQAL